MSLSVSWKLSYYDPPFFSQQYLHDNKLFVGEMTCHLGLASQLFSCREKMKQKLEMLIDFEYGFIIFVSLLWYMFDNCRNKKLKIL